MKIAAKFFELFKIQAICKLYNLSLFNNKL
jgi:hypothetical protein